MVEGLAWLVEWFSMPRHGKSWLAEICVVIGRVGTKLLRPTFIFESSSLLRATSWVSQGLLALVRNRIVIPLWLSREFLRTITVELDALLPPGWRNSYFLTKILSVFPFFSEDLGINPYEIVIITFHPLLKSLFYEIFWLEIANSAFFLWRLS